MTAPALPPPLVPTGDDPTDEALALLRSTTGSLHEALDSVAALSSERRRLVLELRERGVLFSKIAEAAGSTEQTIYKVHREAKDERREAAHAAGDHAWCDEPEVCAAQAAAELAAADAPLSSDDPRDAEVA